MTFLQISGSWAARSPTLEKFARLRALAGLAAFVMALAAPISARADWPERQVKMVVTFPPGSANDAAARIFADALGKKWGKPVVVEDRPGAEGTIGVGSFVASQDDHTLLYTVAGSITVAPMLVEKLPYDVNRDLVPISATTAIALTLTVSNQLSVNSIPELIEALRASPEKYAWNSGPTLPRFVFSAFLKQHDLKMSFVSYRDASQPQADLGEGRIQALLTSLTASSSPVQAGKARFLASSTRPAPPRCPMSRPRANSDILSLKSRGWRASSVARSCRRPCEAELPPTLPPSVAIQMFAVNWRQVGTLC
ncbi:tripartite-type tricarboxylate transporter receptor subunit TctC [Bradyrhizobium algeriense]|uniref:Tripartite-type tricarboxylate transporter receptor subunit TctC n=1 Tax=Bradyrhizobium algeriense TaxID=634784 RepID=A0ABU8BH44_9BRAD